MELRCENLSGQVTDHGEELHENEPDSFDQLGFVHRADPPVELAELDPTSRFDREGFEEREFLGGVVQHALGDRGERDLPQRGRGPSPQRAKSPFEELQKNLRRQVVRRSLEQSVYTGRVLAFVDHALTGLPSEARIDSEEGEWAADRPTISDQSSLFLTVASLR